MYSVPLALFGAAFSIPSLVTAVLAVGNQIQAFWSHFCWHRFKSKTAGLPTLRSGHFLGNHLRTFAYAQNNNKVALEAHKELGKTFGWMYGTKPAASTIDLDLIKTIVQDEGHIHIDRFKPGLPVWELEGSILWAQGDEWRKLRRLFEPALARPTFKTPPVMEKVERSIENLVNLVEIQLENHGGSVTINIDDIVHRYTLDVLFSCFLKQDKEINFDLEPSRWVQFVESSLANAQNSTLFKLAILFPCLRSLLDLTFQVFYPYGFCRNLIAGIAESRVELRRKQLDAAKNEREVATGGELPSKKPTDTCEAHFPIDFMIDGRLSGKMTKREYACNSTSLIALADKTTQTCLVHALHLLATHGDKQEKLRESIKLDGIESEYLSWALNESLRLLPPVQFGCSRTIKRDIRLKSGHILPAGTYVSTSAFVIHRCEEYWGPDAAEFNPERWLNAGKFHPFQFVPFGAGNRQCPGKEFAMFEMKMLLATLITRYKLEAKPRVDVYEFACPLQLCVIPNSPTCIKIKRV